MGTRDIVVAVGDARLIGIDPATGRVLFDQPHGGEPVWISVASAVPMPAGNGRLFVKTHVDNSTMYRLVEAADGRISVETLWTAPVLRQTYAVPVYHDGHLYGMNGRTVFTCVDAETGEMKWRTREPGRRLAHARRRPDRVRHQGADPARRAGEPAGMDGARAPRAVRRPVVDGAQRRRRLRVRAQPRRAGARRLEDASPPPTAAAAAAADRVADAGALPRGGRARARQGGRGGPLPRPAPATAR